MPVQASSPAASIPTASTHDPLSLIPSPPTNSAAWSKSAARPPSPFPWTTSPLSRASSPQLSPPAQVAAVLPTSTDAFTGLASSPGSSSSLSVPLSRKASVGGRQARPANLHLTSDATAFRPPASGRSTPRTPSGFEFLDWGESLDREAKRAVPRTFDWEIHGAASPGTPFSLTNTFGQTFKRRLGPTEASYYLGSRGEGHESGVNDMYLHIGFSARPKLVTKNRIVKIWAELIERHAMLAAEVEYKGLDDIRFVYTPVSSQKGARARAAGLMEMRTSQDPQALIDEYLNGPRILDDERLAYLIISTPEASFEVNGSDTQEFDFFLLSTHFLGDGMALHTTANEFFALLSDASDEPGVELDNIERILAAKAAPKEEDDDGREAEAPGAQLDVATLALAMESKIVTTEKWGRMAWAGARVDFNRTQAQLIGGQSFARASLGDRHTLVPTISYDGPKTKKILGACKANGVTIASAVFALANFAYIRSVESGRAKGERDERMPMMLYSALNVRPWLRKDDSDWYSIAIGYYNIILPSFLPTTSSPSSTFWLRAQSTKSQTSKVVKSKLLTSRAKLMALERERRSIGFAREDQRRAEERQAELSEGLKGLGISFVQTEPDKAVAVPVKTVEEVVKKAVATPSVALMGVSMLGNLDAMYTHANFKGIKVHSLTTGSRQRAGALLLFAYTFAGKLWFSLGYDKNGFKEGVIEAWWAELQQGVEEFLLAA